MTDTRVTDLIGGERSGFVSLLVFDIALPFAAVRLLEYRGVAMVPAFAAAALFPLGSAASQWFRRGRVDVIGLGVAAALVVNVVLTLVTRDVRFSVVKGAPLYALFGAACLVSLATPRPLMFHVARYFIGAGDAEKRAQFEARSARPEFWAVMRTLTWVWGLAALAEATIGIASAILLPPQVTLVAEPLLGFGTVAALLFYTAAFIRRRTRSVP